MPTVGLGADQSGSDMGLISQIKAGRLEEMFTATASKRILAALRPRPTRAQRFLCQIARRRAVCRTRLARVLTWLRQLPDPHLGFRAQLRVDMARNVTPIEADRIEPCAARTDWWQWSCMLARLRLSAASQDDLPQYPSRPRASHECIKMSQIEMKRCRSYYE